MNRRSAAVVAGGALALITLAACAPAAPLGAAAGGITAASETVVFDRSPTAFGDGFVAVRYPDADSPDLTFVITDGSTQWDVRTNPACSGFTVTRVDGEDLLVILDSDASVRDGRIATETVATAFREDGSTAWGPVPVDGGLSEAGLITTEMLGGALTSEPAPGTALSSASGAALDLPTGERPVHAAHGLLATDTPEGVLVHSTGDDSAPTLWRSVDLAPADATGAASVASGHDISTGPVLVLEWPTAHGSIFTVHRFADGTLLSTLPGVPAARTLATPGEDLLFLTSESESGRLVTALSPESGQRWEESVPVGAQPVAATPTHLWFTGAVDYLTRSTSAGAFPRRKDRLPFSH